MNRMRVPARSKLLVGISLLSGWYSSTGPYLKNFEETWARICNRRFGIATSNGTTALISAVEALELNENDEVIIPNFTIISCGLAVMLSGAKMVPVDCELTTFNIDVDQLESHITKNTKAIMVVHMYGVPSDMNRILKIAKKHNLRIIEDAAEAHGAKVLMESTGKWEICGSFGDMSCFSFFANKLITAGEGGIVLTDETQLATSVKDIVNLGFGKVRDYKHRKFGYQFRLTSLQAALAIPQMNNLNKILRKKQKFFETYKKGLETNSKVFLRESPIGTKSSNWVYPILIDANWGTASQLAQELSNVGIETRAFFAGMHSQPIYKNLNLGGELDFPNTEFANRYGLLLPSGVGLTRKEIRYVCREINRIIN